MTYEHLSLRHGYLIAVRRSDGDWNNDIIAELAPMIFKHGGGGQNSHGVDDMVQHVHSAAYIESRRAIGQALGWGEGDWVELLDEQAGYGGLDLGDLMMDKTRDQLGAEDRNIDLFEEIANALDIPATQITGTGYCQGDYIEALAYASPEYIKNRWGDEKPTPEAIQQALLEDGATYTAWAFGDVYDVQLFPLPEGFDRTLLDEMDLQDALDECDPDWDTDPIDGFTLIEQMPDFDTHSDIIGLVPQLKACA